MLKQTGVPTKEDLAGTLPSSHRLGKGAVAIIECFQDIPCNPCSTVCPRGAIKTFQDINDRPEIDHELCNGCAICVANCPGLAIFAVQQDYRPGTSLVKLPFEMYPLPVRGETVDALNRTGDVVCEGTVILVQNPKSFDRTAVVNLEVPQQYAQEVRNIRLKGGARHD